MQPCLFLRRINAGIKVNRLAEIMPPTMSTAMSNIR